MNNHRIGLWALVLAWVGWSAAGIAQIPEGYYAGVDDSTPQTLRSTLHATLKAGHVVRSYNNAIQTIQDANQDPNNSNNIILIYSGISVSKTWDSGNTWNREHVFPQSHFNSNSPYVSDVHALMPTVPTINSRRGNYPFGVVPVGGNPDQYGNKLGTSLGGYTVFEPRDGAKGDVARALFYMDVRYEGTNGELNLLLTNSDAGFAEMGRLNDLLQWHVSDPPDNWERRRNDRIYAAQGNRNPFIDFPQWVDCVYNGNCVGTLAPAAPTNLAATAGIGYIDLDWNANSEPTLEGYRVYRAEDDAGPFELLVDITPPVNFVRDSTVTAEQTYYYEVTAYNTANAESDPSNRVSATPLQDNVPPATPSGFAVSAGSDFIYVQWSPNQEPDLAGYRLYRGLSDPPTELYQAPGPGAAGFLDENVNAGTRYFYTVSAIDNAGNESGKSAVLSTVPGGGSAGCGVDLIFSEYAKGTVGFNRALELFNTTGNAIVLDGYTIEMYPGAGTTPAVELSLTGKGVVPPLGTFVIVHQSAGDPTLFALADMNDEGTGSWFNGDDPIVLKHNGVPIDSIGQVGNAAVYGNNVTLRRKSDVVFGRNDPFEPFVLADEWSSFAANTWPGLGTHEFDCELSDAVSATISLLDPTVTDRDALRFEVEFSMPVSGLFDVQAVTAIGSLAGEATIFIDGTDPVYTIAAVLEDATADGTIGIVVGGGELENLSGGFEETESALYTITNSNAGLAGDFNGDGVVNVADVTALAQWIADGKPTQE